MSRFIAIFSSKPAQMLNLTRSLSPRVEVHPRGGIIVEAPDRYEQATLNQLLQRSNAWGRIDFASASTRTAALLAARARPGSSVPPGKEREFMAPFPIHLLGFHEDVEDATMKTLNRWGIRTLGQLSELPNSRLAARLGETGLRLQKLARGEDLLPFQAQPETRRFEAVQQLDWELDSLEPLTFVLGGLLEQLCSRLRDRGLAADRLRIVLRLNDGVSHERDVALAFPMRDPKTLLSLVRLKLQSDAPQKPIQSVRLEARPARPQSLQRSLLEPDSPDPEKLSRTLARLASLSGEENLGSAIMLDTHRPDAFQMNAFSATARGNSGRRSFRGSLRSGKDKPLNRSRALLALKRIRPPAPIRLQTKRIAACAGPWRRSGDWWEEETTPENPDDPPPSDSLSPMEIRHPPWSRDEWDVEFTDGRIGRIFWDQRRKQWFLEGIYD